MKRTGKPIYVEAFSTERAEIKVSFSVQDIVLSLQNELKKRLLKKGFQLSESENETVIISGEFVIINEGSQLFRWFTGPLGVGYTKLELEGTVKENGKEINNFNFSKKGRLGVFGGNSKNLLMSSANRISKDIVKLLI